MRNYAKANKLLDETCRKTGLDPVDVRLAMIQTLQTKLANGKDDEKFSPNQLSATYTHAA